MSTNINQPAIKTSDGAGTLWWRAVATCVRKAMGLVCIFCAAVGVSAEPGMLKVGIGRADITPDMQQPVWLAGYAARSAPATGTLHRIWAKALAFEENPGQCAVLVTVDVIGLTREITDVVAETVHKRHGVPRAHLVFNASHTHSGPVIWPTLSVCDAFTPQERQQTIRQNREMTERIIAAVDMAMATRAPVRLATGRGTAGFAINRRKREVAPVDHTVPVLRVCAPDGAVRAVVFNYACHCTTLTSDNLMVNGDYAGFAMLELESTWPGATAFFIQGCAADQNPEPRHTEACARQHGQALAAAVRDVMNRPMQEVTGPLSMKLAETRLAFEPVPLARMREEALDTNRFKQKRAQLMLEAYCRGAPVTSMPYTVQALRFGNTLTFLFLNGEVVIDYTLRARREFPDDNLVVAGYCNDVQAYIPSLRVLKEGGYEANDSMIYYGQPGPFTDDVEETVFRAIRDVLTR